MTGATGADGGTDTFFLDGTVGTTWDTIVNFHPGDSATLWGFVPGQSAMIWAANDGAAGHTGATIHAAFAGAGTAINGSLTFASLGLADAQSKLSLTPRQQPVDAATCMCTITHNVGRRHSGQTAPQRSKPGRVSAAANRGKPTMTDKTKTEHADRTVGGPGSSHQNADKPETHHHRERERDAAEGQQRLRRPSGQARRRRAPVRPSWPRGAAPSQRLRTNETWTGRRAINRRTVRAMTRPTHDGLPQPLRGWAVATSVIAVGMASLDTSIANTALPTIAGDLNATAAASVWVVNAYQLTLVATLLPFAALGEIYGFRRVYTWGVALFTVASLLCALSWSLPTLTAARVLQGLGASGIMSVNTALIRFIYPSNQLGRGVGFNALVVAVVHGARPHHRRRLSSPSPRGNGCSRSTCRPACWRSPWRSGRCPTRRARRTGSTCPAPC